jgi:hypothetical protein
MDMAHKKDNRVKLQRKRAKELGRGTYVPNSMDKERDNV